MCRRISNIVSPPSPILPDSTRPIVSLGNDQQGQNLIRGRVPSKLLKNVVNITFLGLWLRSARKPKSTILLPHQLDNSFISLSDKILTTSIPYP
jgi:hypothetical protein